MARSNGKRKGRRQTKGKRRGYRKAGAGPLIRGLLVIAAIIFILGAWYNVNPRTFEARMADIGFTAGDTR